MGPNTCVRARNSVVIFQVIYVKLNKTVPHLLVSCPFEAFEHLVFSKSLADPFITYSMTIAIKVNI